MRRGREPQAAPGFPLTLNTGRVRDHWHTMTRTGKSQRLSQHCAEPFVEINPHDAARHHIGDADLVRVSTGLGAILVRALVTPRQQPGSIFVPMHWNDQFASRARVDVLAAAVTDPISGQPASKKIPVRVERFVAATYGFAVLRRKPTVIPAEYWAIAKCSGGWRVEMAFAAHRRRLGRLCDRIGRRRRNELVAYHDAQTGRHRFACYEDDRLAGAVFLAPEPVAVSRDWAIAQLGAPNLARRKRTRSWPAGPAKEASIAGRPFAPASAWGPTRSPPPSRRGCTTVSAIGDALHAGTNCGSCRSEIRNIIDAQLATAVLAQPRTLVTSA